MPVGTDDIIGRSRRIGASCMYDPFTHSLGVAIWSAGVAECAKAYPACSITAGNNVECLKGTRNGQTCRLLG